MLVTAAEDADLAFIREQIGRERLDPEPLKTGRFVVWRERSDGPIVAFGSIKAYGGEVYELCSVFVDRARRGSGLGAVVVRELMRRFPTPEVYITTDLHEYFARFGFTMVPDAEVPPPIAAKLKWVCASLREGVVAMRAPRPG